MSKFAFFVIMVFTISGIAKENSMINRQIDVAKKLCHYQEITEMDISLNQKNANFVLAYDCYTTVIHKNILNTQIFDRIQQYSQLCLIDQMIRISKKTHSDKMFKKSYTECFIPSLY